MSVLDHLRELRRRLIIVMLVIAAGAVVGWLVYNPLLEILKHPYCNIPYQHRFGALNQSEAQCKLQFRAPLDGFTIRLKVSVVAGAVLTARSGSTSCGPSSRRACARTRSAGRLPS